MDGNGKADTFNLLVDYFFGVDPDYIALFRDERSTAITRIDLSAGLD